MNLNNFTLVLWNRAATRPTHLYFHCVTGHATFFSRPTEKRFKKTQNPLPRDIHVPRLTSLGSGFL